MQQMLDYFECYEDECYVDPVMQDVRKDVYDE